MEDNVTHTFWEQGNIKNIEVFSPEEVQSRKTLVNEVNSGFRNYLIGKKESQDKPKAPIFTFCKQMKNAIEALSLRSLYGHEKYKEYDKDWQNFSRVENAEEEYGNAQFRHALGIGEDKDEDHHVAEAWNAIARLEMYLRNKTVK